MKEFSRFFNIPETQAKEVKSVDDFISQFGGRQFNDGLFRVFKFEDLEMWQNNVESAFTNFKGKFKLFAFDWLGRCFGVDLRKNTFGNILMFEIGTNDVLEIPCQFFEFLNEEIPQYHDECLASSFYNEWKNSLGKSITYSECVGYKVPLFLNGIDNIDNLEVSDMDVYWHIFSQIISQL